MIGFTSKAGNVFDTCLKYENEMISFDFDDPGEDNGGSGADLAWVPGQEMVENLQFEEDEEEIIITDELLAEAHADD